MKLQEDRAEHDLGIAADFSSSSLESYLLVFRSPPSLHFLASLAVGVAMRLIEFYQEWEQKQCVPFLSQGLS